MDGLTKFRERKENTCDYVEEYDGGIVYEQVSRGEKESWWVRHKESTLEIFRLPKHKFREKYLIEKSRKHLKSDDRVATR